MLKSLDQAPIGMPLRIWQIREPTFATHLARLGLHEGGSIMRLNESVAIGPVKVLGPRGEVILSGDLAAQVVMHLDDNRRIPLLECGSGASGHVEGLTGQDVVEALAMLGVVENDRLTCLRRMPPMTYHAIVEGKHRIQLNEDLAANLIGDTPAGESQFCSVGVGEPFVVRRILPGERPRRMLESLHVRLGSTLTLVSVTATPVVGSPLKHPIVCATKDGLRLYFHQHDAKQIFVAPMEQT